MLTIHTTQSLSRSGNSTVLCQQLKLTGSSLQDKKQVPRNVKQHSQCSIGERKDVSGRSSWGEGKPERSSTVPARGCPLRQCEAWASGSKRKRKCRVGVCALTTNLPSDQSSCFTPIFPTPLHLRAISLQCS